MKKILLFTLSAALMLFASCQKSYINNGKENGFLSFGELVIGVDESLATKADPAGDNYSVAVYNADGDKVVSMTYAQVKENGDMISLPAGSYTLVAQSLAGDVPHASWENPIYGTSEDFSIEAGEVTSIGELVCTLLQCKVTVAYNDEFLEAVTGACTTKVEVSAGHPLEYKLGADKKYDQSAGYFAVNGTTMVVTFSGNIDGKSAKMSKTFTGIAPKQWRQVKFIQKKNEQGQATFDIVIQDLVSDETLNEDFGAEEDIIGEDPDKPKGDGGITLDFDYESGCDEELTDLNNMVIVPMETRVMSIKLKAVVPGTVKKFTVDISSDSDSFLSAVDLADARHIDLINPTEQNGVIFDVVPVPHGADLLGQTEILFDLSNAQEAILIFPGRHTFTMTIMDAQGCSNTIPVTMIVE